MSRPPRPARLSRSTLLAALWLALPSAAGAQSATASRPTTPPDMPGMAMPPASSSTSPPAVPAEARKRATRAAPAKPRPSSHDTAGMPGMDHPGTTAVPMSSAPAGMGDMKPMKGMDHGAMQGMPMPGRPAGSAAPAGDMPGMDHSSMPGMGSASTREMDHRGMDHGTVPATGPGGTVGIGTMAGMAMGPMQGGHAPADARSPDYSDGVGHGTMQGMDMADDAPLGMLLVDRLEGFHRRGANGQAWEAQGWYGNDANKLWVRTEGRRSHGKFDDGDLEAFWNRAIAAYWSSQLGVRQDLGEGPERTWAAVGVQGLAPYWFGLEATGYIGTHGRTAARLRADYELRFTQRLILQPEAEVNLYGKSDPQRRIGSGVSDVQFGLRLRYECQRQFAPYVGVHWVRRLGATADDARQDHLPVLDRQLVAGVRIWF